MKTGFIQGFVNLMKPVTYPYHGILNRCGKQPEIPPYIGPDMKPVGQEWVIAFEGSIYTYGTNFMYFRPGGFLPSSDEHMCPVKTYCQKNVYYFAEFYIWQPGANQWMCLSWSDGINCKMSATGGVVLYIYKAWFNYQWCANDILGWVFNTGPSSTARIWKSLTGEFPGYYPFRQQEIIRV